MNGVVVITTKKGRAGKLNVSYIGNFSTYLKPDYRDFDIMNSAQQMSERNLVVIEAITTIAAISEETSASTEEVTATAEEENTAVQQVNTLAENLSQIASNLNQSVAFFKL